ncbi:MAG: hypothetical protein ABI700_11195, partial [Chloroflexota bacterium]
DSTTGYVDTSASFDGAYGASIPCLGDCGVDSNSVMIWRLSHQQGQLQPPTMLKAPSLPGSQMTSIQFSPTENKLAATTDDGHLLLWDLDKPDQPEINQGFTADLVKPLFTTNGNQLLIGVHSTVELWQITDNELVLVKHFYDPSVEASTAEITHLALSVNGERALSTDDDGRITLWDMETGEALATFPSQNPRINAIAFSEDGSNAIYTDSRGSVYSLQLSETDSAIVMWTENNRLPLFSSEDCNHYAFTDYCPPK